MDDSASPPRLSSPRARVLDLRRHPAARALLDAAEGRRVLLVGGATRDAALERPVGDLDAIVASDGARVADRLATALGGRAIALAPGRFAAVRVVAPELEVDIWDLEGGRVELDLARRDLTINAIALDLAAGEIVDPYGGLADLQQRRLRAVAPATFDEDALRVLRLARLAVALGDFEVEPSTAELARRAAHGLATVAGERIRDELSRLADSAAAGEEQRALELVGAFPGLWDDFTPARGDSAIAIFEAYATRRAQLGPAIDRADEIAARHALRLRTAPSTRTPAERLAVLARRAVLSRAESRRIACILELGVASPPAGDDRDLWLSRLGSLWPTAFAAAAAAAPAAASGAWDHCLERAATAVASRGDDLTAPRPLLDGTEIARLLGIEEGPEVGRALEELIRAQVLERVSTVEEARRHLALRRRRVERIPE